MRLLLFILVGVCALAATAAGTAAAEASPLRPMDGRCATTFTIGFDPQAGLPVVDIVGSCQFTHLGATTYTARQLLYPDATIVNDGTYTAANGDQLRAHAVGTQNMPEPCS